MYLVDTNVLSASAPTKAVLASALVAWMDRNSHGLFLSVITIAETEKGIAKSRRQGSLAKADRLSEWLRIVLQLYGDRVVPIDLAIARRMGVLADLLKARGHASELADVAIAATALHHGWTVLTRNLRHFDPLGGPAADPFNALPADCV